MKDIWDSVGVHIAQEAGEWFYQEHNVVKGPFSQQIMQEKLLRGDINAHTMIARDGTDFHVLAQVRVFASHLQEAEVLHAKRQTQQQRKWFALFIVCVLSSAAITHHFIQRSEQKHLQAQRARAAAKAALAKQQEEERIALAKSMALVPLVSLGNVNDVVLQHAIPAFKKTPHVKQPHHQQDTNNMQVATCGLSQQDIFQTLRHALIKLNSCVDNEKKRNPQKPLPDTLLLNFIVQPNGRAIDFAIDNRDYRQGLLHNCLATVFASINFPRSQGINCPVTIPIKMRHS